MKYLLSLSLVFSFSSLSFGQNSQLNLSIDYYDTENDQELEYIIIHNKDTIARETFYYEISKEYDSLEVGLYTIFISSYEVQNKPIIQREYNLYLNEITSASISLSFYEDIQDADNPEEEFSIEIQSSYGYFRDAWMNQKSGISSSVSFAETIFTNVPVAKHVSFLWGLGLGFSHHNFSKDTSYFNISEFTQKKEKYTYLSYIIDMKFSFFSGKNNLKDAYNKKITLEIGASYNFPLYFRHVGVYENDVKLSESRINQLSDVRTYANFGYYPFVFFGEYRPFDFVTGNLPEISKYNFGIKFLIPSS